MMNRPSAAVRVMFVLVTSACALGQSKQKTDVELAVITDANLAIARIGDLEITGEELRSEIIRGFSPDAYRFKPQLDPVVPQAVLMRLLGDKALVIDARQRGLLNEGNTPKLASRFRTKERVTALALTIVPTMPEVSDEEVADYQKQKAGATAEQARRQLSNLKATQLMDEFYQQLIKTCNFKKHSEAFVTGAKVHQRLLTAPQKPRRQSWIQNDQFKDEVTAQEKALVLAEWDGGKYTLEDWFDALGQFSPPSRPRNLSTPEGFEAFLDRLVRQSVLETEALRRHLDQRPDILKRVRAYEDRLLLGRVQSEVSKSVPDPNETAMREFYNLAIGQEDLMTQIKVETIWCKDRSSAEQARAALNGGGDFNEVQTKYTIEDSPRPQHLTSQSQGIFWESFKDAEIHAIVGPLPGMFQRNLAWRVMRVVDVEKRDFPTFEAVKSRLAGEIRQDIQAEVLEKKGATLLETMPYEILTTKPDIFDPRYVP